MKAIVFSDSHGSSYLMNELCTKFKSKIDCIIHLGDCVEDTEDFRDLCPNTAIYQVRGNNDYGSSYPSSQIISFGGKRIFMVHGHRQRVYYNTDSLYYAAMEEFADIALFGHTHVPYLENEGGILMLNPGSISLPRSSLGKTFAFITIENGKSTLSVMGWFDGDIRILKTLTI